MCRILVGAWHDAEVRALGYVATMLPWGHRLRSLGEGRLAGTPLMSPATPDERQHFLESFADDVGNRRPVDRAMLAWMMQHEPGPAPAREVLQRNPDAALWWVLHGRGDVEGIIEPGGPLFPRLHALAIEMWTEAELCGLHALSHLARRDQQWWPRCIASARWLMDEVQPDNATNHPWAIHVFSRLAAEGDGHAEMYAGTLLHNCMVGGVVDRFSAAILLDAGRWLELDAPRT